VRGEEGRWFGSSYLLTKDYPRSLRLVERPRDLFGALLAIIVRISYQDIPKWAEQLQVRMLICADRRRKSRDTGHLASMIQVRASWLLIGCAGFRLWCLVDGCGAARCARGHRLDRAGAAPFRVAGTGWLVRRVLAGAQPLQQAGTPPSRARCG